MNNTAFVRVTLSAIRENLSVVRALCKNSRIMATVKANAYGHGLLEVANALESSDGFAVARLHEALDLRRAGIEHRILLLGTLLDEAALATCSRFNIDVTAHDSISVTRIASQATRMPLRVWLKLDSGMHRVGLPPRAFVEADHLLSANTGVIELVHMTHFSSAGDMTTDAMDRQLQCFAECHATNPRAHTSLANSAALIARPETRGDWVRPGIMLYGDNPLGFTEGLTLKPAMRLSARVIAIRDLATGESVGYNSLWTSERPSRIATIGAGYADGYPRHAGNGTPVWINGHFGSVAGRVSMDSIGVDITDCGPVNVGDEAVLWGPELPASKVADHASTISYALFTAVTQRVTREYRA